MSTKIRKILSLEMVWKKVKRQTTNYQNYPDNILIADNSIWWPSEDNAKWRTVDQGRFDADHLSEKFNLMSSGIKSLNLIGT